MAAARPRHIIESEKTVVGRNEHGSKADVIETSPSSD
jgi:hypothetical protein